MKLKKAIRYFLLAIVLSILLPEPMTVNSTDSDTLLKSPGLRLIHDPLAVVPASDHYLNQKVQLPRYRDTSGIPISGWSREFIKTRRFSSDQSAWVYYRVSDLKRAEVIKTSGIQKTIRIWPVGTTIILEAYKGNALRDNGKNLLEIEAMNKMDFSTISAAKMFYPINWSYARFTPDGKSSLSSIRLNECHQCHSIAFRLTGDLVFTQFP